MIRFSSFFRIRDLCLLAVLFNVSFPVAANQLNYQTRGRYSCPAVESADQWVSVVSGYAYGGGTKSGSGRSSSQQTALKEAKLDCMSSPIAGTCSFDFTMKNGCISEFTNGAGGIFIGYDCNLEDAKKNARMECDHWQAEGEYCSSVGAICSDGSYP